MYKALDIANKLIKVAADDEANGGEAMSSLKLQKLLYFEQGYHLAVFNTPLFDEDIEAWTYGPVVPCVYEHYKKFEPNALPIEGQVTELNHDEEVLFYEVFDLFREYSAIGLMNKTHQEGPWKQTPLRGVIGKQAIQQFFYTQVE